MKDFWLGLTPRSRAGLLVGAMLIVLGMAITSWWLLRTDYQVLFADLKPQDAAAMTAELERLKMPYQVADNGAVILVDKASVHATRIKVMGKELPLHGAVGFELFNNTDFGMTEFAQKINYQRALQGELTRTIAALSEVQDVRVHLALPEQGLFKQATNKAKAAITLTLRPGQTLRAEQVTGIGRLVAAAVPGMVSQDVTIADNQGVVLSRSASDGEPELGGARMDLKRETDNYLSRKAGAVLERVFGPGQALASVDVALDMDQVRVTTEEVLPAANATPGRLAPTGVVVRERESARDGAAPLDVKGGSETSGSAGLHAAAAGAITQREIEYQVGRRVEQVVSQPGSIRRIQAVAVLRQPLDLTQQEQVRKMVAAAIGALPERGDTVVVQVFSGAAAPSQTGARAPDLITGGGATAGSLDEAANNRAVAKPAAPIDRSSLVVTILGALLLATILVVLVMFVRARPLVRGRDPTMDRTGLAHPLTEAQQEVALQQVRNWMGQSTPGSTPSAPAPPTQGVA